jgi:hypothetical protein
MASINMAFTCEAPPTFIYSYAGYSEVLWRTHLVTGEDSSLRVPSYQFKECCVWCEVPGGSLLITGGGDPVAREVVKIDTHREFAVSQQTPMLTPRRAHACVYHAQCLYVVGGFSGRNSLKECERYARGRWEALPPVPKACFDASGVVVETVSMLLEVNVKESY